MSSLKSRVLVSVIGIPVLVWVVLAGPELVIMAALALLAGIGASELQHSQVIVRRSRNRDRLPSDMAFHSVFSQHLPSEILP